MKNEGEKLKRWLKNSGIKHEDVTEAFGRVAKTAIYELYKKDELPVSYVKMFHYMLQFPLEELYDSEDKQLSVLSRQARNNYVKFYCSPLRRDFKNQVEYEDKIREYYISNKDTTVKSFKRAKHRIAVGGYYPAWEKKHNIPLAYSVFYEVQREYFGSVQIELIDKPEDFKYIRCIQIKQPIYGVAGLSKVDLAKYAIEFLSLASLKHVCWCLQNCEEIFDLYVVNEPYRYYTFCLEDKDFMIAEYARFDKQGKFIPDTYMMCRNMHDEKDSGQISKFIELHHNHIQDLETKKELYLISKEDIKNAIQSFEYEMLSESASLAYTQREQWVKEAKLTFDVLKDKELKDRLLQGLFDVHKENEKKKIDAQKMYKTKREVLLERINIVREELKIEAKPLKDFFL